MLRTIIFPGGFGVLSWGIRLADDDVTAASPYQSVPVWVALAGEGCVWLRPSNPVIRSDRFLLRVLLHVKILLLNRVLR